MSAQVLDRESAVEFYCILAAEHGRVNLGRSSGPMTCHIAPPCYAASLGVLGRNPSAANAAGYSTSNSESLSSTPSPNPGGSTRVSLVGYAPA